MCLIRLKDDEKIDAKNPAKNAINQRSVKPFKLAMNRYLLFKGPVPSISPPGTADASRIRTYAARYYPFNYSWLVKELLREKEEKLDKNHKAVKAAESVEKSKSLALPPRRQLTMLKPGMIQWVIAQQHFVGPRTSDIVGGHTMSKSGHLSTKFES